MATFSGHADRMQAEQTEMPARTDREPPAHWSGTRSAYPSHATMAALFAGIAANHSAHIAVEEGGRSLTYAQLDRLSNRLAHRLRALGVGPESMVACCCERSVDLIVALVAIIKAGGAYVPLDPAYPTERLRYMLDDTRCVAAVTTSALADTVAGLCQLPMLRADADIEHGEDGALPSLGGPTSLAYVMYTSGSTGQPKGVLVEQRSIVRLVRDTNYCRFGAGEVWLHFAPLAFDASTLEIWGALLNGGRLVVAPPRASLEQLGRIIRERGVTSLWLTSGLFNLVVEQRLGDLSGVRQLLAGGDVLSPRHVRQALEALPGCTLINGYGPTENTTFTCCHVMPSGSRVLEPIPIGRPIANTQVYILDEAMRLVPAGVAGELYAGGDGVARGYLNNAKATAEKFLPDPFSRAPGARLYRTGDLARWREDGAIEFIGRVDNQVKILGHRIEPGEIEQVLGAHPGVGQACVAVHTDDAGANRLMGYYVPRQETVTPAQVRAYLAAKLPRHMIPALLVPLCAMPLNGNGKIDRSQLPKPAIATGFPAAPAAAASIEDVIVQSWRAALKTDRVGLDDNFFDLGGDSLRLVAVHAALERQLEREIPILDMFEFNTVRDLARRLRGEEAGANAAIVERQRAQLQRAAFARRRSARSPQSA